MAIKEPFRPQWVELKDSQSERQRVLRKIYGSTKVGASNALAAIVAERDRWHALASQREVFISELEDALRLAEGVAEQALEELHARTKPVGRGQGRNIEMSEAAKLAREVDYVLHCADADREDALRRQRDGLPPIVPPLIAAQSVVCGADGLTQRDAVRIALWKRHRSDSTGVLLAYSNLMDLVDKRLDGSLRTYQRELRRRRELAIKRHEIGFLAT